MVEAKNEGREQCIRCDEYAAQRKPSLKFIAKVNGEVVDYCAPGWLCESCGNIWSTAADEDEHVRLSAEAYRKEHLLLTAAEMEEKRAMMGLTKSAFTNMLGVPRVTYDRWLKGIVQGEAMDQALRAKLDERAALFNSLRLTAQRFAELPSNLRGNTRPNLTALYSMIHFFVTQREEKEIGELYLNKLCWYADQIAFIDRGQSISGWPYVCLQFGPVISSYDQVFRSMILAGYLTEAAAHNFELGECAHELPKLENSERDFLQQVWKAFGHRLKKLLKHSHDEVAWQKTAAFQEIDFSLSKRLLGMRK